MNSLQIAQDLILAEEGDRPEGPQTAEAVVPAGNSIFIQEVSQTVNVSTH